MKKLFTRYFYGVDSMRESYGRCAAISIMSRLATRARHGLAPTEGLWEWGALARGWLIIRARVCGHTVPGMVGPAGTAIRTTSPPHNQKKWRRGTRRSSAHEYNRYRCSLPGLTELTTHRREGTDSGRQGG